MKTLALLCCLTLTMGCGVSPPDTVTADVAPVAGAAASAIDSPEKLIAALEPDDALLVGAGDIAKCPTEGSAAADTAALIAKFPNATVFTLGDNAYGNGTKAQFDGCYDKVWGGFKERTRPSPGNHDYGIYPPAHRNNAKPYFEYFGANAGPPGDGYYSYDLGGWHVVSLNSMAGELRAAPSMQKQVDWLEADLAATQKPCILAYWHHPLFSSGYHGYESHDPGRRMVPLWRVLRKHKADVVVNGHDHHYERFAPQTLQGFASPQGIREFVVGNGGAETRRVLGIKPNSEVRLDGLADYGILALTLHPNSYEWHFFRTDGTVPDSSPGRQECY